MVLHQFGIYRTVKTPLEFANDTVDPEFGTEFGQFMNVYLKAKYSPQGLASSEAQFVENFTEDFREKVFQPYSRWDVIKNFLNFIRTLRFLFVK